MKIMYNKFLIISTVVLIIGGAYLYFSDNLNSEIVPVAYGSSLTSSNILDKALSSIGSQINSDISFLNTLVSLKEIKIDTVLFNNKNFNSLKNNTVKIEPVVAGRSNPFVSIIDQDINNNNNSTADVITDQPTQITDKTVILNGTVSMTNNVTDTYFEYGTTEVLGSITTIVKPSLVGSFIKNISGLTPKTNYFFKACAKINNIKSCGNLVSFTTN